MRRIGILKKFCNLAVADPRSHLNLVCLSFTQCEAAQRYRKETRMQISAKRLETLREHIRAESEHDMETLIKGMTTDCFNDVAGSPKPFVGPEQTAERYRKHWEGFPDFSVRVRRVLCSDENTVVTENEWRGTHLGTFLGWPATGKPVRMRAIVVWHFKGDDLWCETVFFDNASLLKQIGATIDVPAPSGSMKPAIFKLDDPPLVGHGTPFEQS
jgi:steroid delta-isomerase-like uncharacterized protein